MSNFKYKKSGAVAAADFILDRMSEEFERGFISVTFYSDVGRALVVTPTAGTITFTASEDGVNFGTIPNGTITALNVGPAVNYVRPNWVGMSTAVKMNLSGIADANFFEFVINRFGE